MVVSKLAFKGITYDGWQLGGAGVVLLGIAVVLAPQLSGAPTPATAATATNGSPWIWSLVIIASCVPMCLSSVYKEKALGEQDVGVVYLNGWVAVFQSLLAIPLAIPSAWATHVPLSELPYNVRDGFLCLAGINSIVDLPDDDSWWRHHGDPYRNDTRGYDLLNPADALSKRADACEMAPYYVPCYMFFNLFYNILTIVILKKGSSNLLYLGSTVLVPISNAMFSLKIMPGHQPLHRSDIEGLGVIMLGLLLYRAGSSFAKAVKARLSLEEKRPRVDSYDAVGPLPSPFPGVPSPLVRDASRALRKRTSFGTASSRRIARFFGANQLEMLEPLVEAQKRRARHRLIKSNAQIRLGFLNRLGFTPEMGARAPRSGSPLGHQRRMRQSPPAPVMAPLGERRRARSFGQIKPGRGTRPPGPSGGP